MLIINIMQKILNMHRFALYTLLLRTLLNSKAGLLAGLTLLLLAGAINPVKAQKPVPGTTTFTKDFVTLRTTGTKTTSTKYYTNTKTGAIQPYQGAILGIFDRNADTLRLTSEANLMTTGSDVIKTVQLLYRVYPKDTIRGIYVPMTLALQRAKGKSSSQWLNNTSNPNLLAATSGKDGTYVLEIYFQASISNAGTTRYVSDANSGGGGTSPYPNYTATFVVKNSTIPKQWIGKYSSDWFDARNWSPVGYPNDKTDVTISFNPSLVAVYPILTDPTRVATVRNLRIVGKSSGTVGATITLKKGQLAVYGDFQDSNGGFKQSGGLFSLAGGSQTFDGATEFTSIQIDGGGTKTLTRQISILDTLNFKSGVLVTRLDNVISYNVTLSGESARVLGESENSYVLGVLRATRTVVPTQGNDFGGIGVDLTVSSGATNGSLSATRTSSVYTGPGTSASIRRGFTFNQGGSTIQSFSLVFHYLNADLNGIAPANLILFRQKTDNSGYTYFESLPKISADPFNKTLTSGKITGTPVTLFTLGDATNPLPVGLTSFLAVAQGPDAVLTWATAQETNNKGFEVQVSGDGAAFRTLGFVAAETPNSAAARSYRFRDTEGGKQGTRYYRLRQLDLDGGESFFGPQAVAFGAQALTASALGYPNPFGAELTLALQTLAAGPAAVSLFDMAGRQVRAWQPTMEVGTTNMRLDGLQGLPHGLYVMQVRYSDGQTQRLKLIKE